MKRFIILFTALALSISAFLQPTLADDITIKVLIDGKKVEFDQPPIIEEGRTLVPMRAIFEALGATVAWDEATQTVTSKKDSTTIIAKIDSKDLTVNGKSVALDVAPKIVNGRTLVPARAVAESFGASVSWNDDTQTVIITTSQSQAADVSEDAGFSKPKYLKEPYPDNYAIGTGGELLWRISNPRQITADMSSNSISFKTDGWSTIRYMPEIGSDNYIFEVDMTMNEDLKSDLGGSNSFGIMLRANQDFYEGYYFMFTKTKEQIKVFSRYRKDLSGAPSGKWPSQSIDLEVGKTVHIKATVKNINGEVNIILEIDGEELFDIIDDSERALLKGVPGFYGGGSGAPVDVTFSNMKITLIN